MGDYRQRIDFRPPILRLPGSCSERIHPFAQKFSLFSQTRRHRFRRFLGALFTVVGLFLELLNRWTGRNYLHICGYCAMNSAGQAVLV